MLSRRQVVGRRVVNLFLPVRVSMKTRLTQFRTLVEQPSPTCNPRLARPFTGISDVATSLSSDLGHGYLKDPHKLHPFWVDIVKHFKRPMSISLSMQLDHSNAFGYPGLIRDPYKGIPREKFLRKMAYGGVFSDLLRWKENQPLNIHLVRIGDFYEACGIDALILIEYCGLNNMGKRIQAGFPCKNIQDTLDELTNCGFSVSIFEQISDTNAQRGKAIQRKIRTLSQIVSPMSPVYLNNLLLKEGPISFRQNQPIVGILHQISGYTLIEIDLQLRTVSVQGQLTKEALLSKLYLAAPAFPVFVHSTRFQQPEKNISVNSIFDGILKQLQQSNLGISSSLRIATHLPSDPSRFCHTLLKHICRLQKLTPKDFMVVHPSRTSDPTESGPRTLPPSTASFLGVDENIYVPDLLKYILPTNAPNYTKRFLREWIISPPPYRIADVMQSLCRALAHKTSDSENFTSILNARAMPLHKVAALLRGRQCNPSTFREIVHNLVVVKAFVEEDRGEKGSTGNITDLMWKLITCYSSSIMPSKEEFLERITFLIDLIQNCVFDPSGNVDIPSNLKTYRLLDSLFIRKQQPYVVGHANHTLFTDLTDSTVQFSEETFSSLLFFHRLERKFRSRINRSSNVDIQKAYNNVESSVEQFWKTAMREFSNSISIEDLMNNEPTAVQNYKQLVSLSPLEYNFMHNQVSLSSKINSSKNKGTSEARLMPRTTVVNTYGRRKDRQSLTTENLQQSVNRYMNALVTAEKTVENELRQLCGSVEPYLAIIGIAAHFIVILQATYFHVSHMLKHGWCIPDLESLKTLNSAIPPLIVKAVSPYWLLRPQPSNISSNCLAENDVFQQYNPEPNLEEKFFDFDTSTSRTQNDSSPSSSCTDIELNGMVLLTAPNMSGKSTLIRSTLSVALLANCGLMVPCHHAFVPRFDGFFIRGGVNDVPLENRSGFGQEMSDTCTILRDITNRSLVMFDELGSTTSSSDGAAIAGAILEELDCRGSLGIFSTHFHQLFGFNLRLKHVTEMCMSYDSNADTNEIFWKFTISKGRCYDSLGLVTARQFGIAEKIIQRAQEIKEQYNIP